MKAKIIKTLLLIALLIPVSVNSGQEKRYPIDYRDYEIKNLERRIKLQHMKAEILIREIRML